MSSIATVSNRARWAVSLFLLALILNLLLQYSDFLF